MKTGDNSRTLIKPTFLPLGQISAHNAKAYGDVVATVHNGRETSWQQFDIFANCVANGLRAQGISKGGRVVYIGKNTDHAYEIMHGVAKAECVFTPVNWRLTADEVEVILGDANPGVIFVAKEFSSLVGKSWESSARIIELDENEGSAYIGWRDAQATSFQVLEPDLEDIVMQLYTSGTTGAPKGVLWSHRYIVNAAKMLHQADEEVFGTFPGELFLNFLPIFHVGGILTAHYHPCVRGCGTVILSDFDPAEIFRQVSAHSIPVLFGVPTMFQLYLEHPEFARADLSRIRYCAYGAAPMPLKVRDRMNELMSCRFSQIYGATESAHVTELNPEDHLVDSERLRSVGRALPGVELRIFDSEGNVLPPGEVGEVAVKSPVMFSGYHNRPEASEAVIRDGWYMTGDGGYLDEDGYLFLKDRIKDLIISGGENIYPAEVEATLSRAPGVKSIAVVGVEDEKWGEVPVGFVVPVQAGDFDLATLDAYAREHLARFKIPRYYRLLEELPQNALGKILKTELREMARETSNWLTP